MIHLLLKSLYSLDIKQSTRLPFAAPTLLVCLQWVATRCFHWIFGTVRVF